MNAITLDEAKRDLSQLIQQVSADAEPTIICGTEGDKAVLLFLDEFSSWLETHHLLSNPANAEHLRQSIEEAKGGTTTERDLVDP